MPIRGCKDRYFSPKTKRNSKFEIQNSKLSTHFYSQTLLAMLFLEKFFYICNAKQPGVAPSCEADIFFDESVFAFIPCIEIWKISLAKGSNTLVTLYWYLSGAPLAPHRYGCGVLFIWPQVFQNLDTDKRIDSTLSIFINLPFWSWMVIEF